jgi:hypothetical protein
MTKASEFPVFHDPLGRRWRRIRRIWLAVSVIVTALAVIFIASVFAKPVLPGFNLKALKPKPPNIPANPTERKARKAQADLQRALEKTKYVAPGKRRSGANHSGDAPIVCWLFCQLG